MMPKFKLLASLILFAVLVPYGFMQDLNAMVSSKILPRPPADCGQSNGDRIFGGMETTLGEFGWMALLIIRDSYGNVSMQCGASLINSRYVVTAAHCILTTDTTDWELSGVRLGEHNTSNPDPDCDQYICADLPVEVGIENVTIHEKYFKLNNANFNDIALIRFDRDIKFSDFVTPICLPMEKKYRQMNHTARIATVAGWGLTEHNRPSDVLLKVMLEVTDHQNCKNIYKNHVQLRNTHLCAGRKKGKDECTGDSGGPLMREIDGNYYLVGIVSFGPTRCGIKGIPSVYTNVAEFIDWILGNME